MQLVSTTATEQTVEYTYNIFINQYHLIIIKQVTNNFKYVLKCYVVAIISLVWRLRLEQLFDNLFDARGLFAVTLHVRFASFVRTGYLNTRNSKFNN